MDTDTPTEAGTMPDVTLIPAGSIGFLLYPWVLQLILANPPANDSGNQAPEP